MQTLLSWAITLFSFQNFLPLVTAQCGTSRRRSWRSLSCREQQDFINAVQRLKDSGSYNELVDIHWTTGQSAHEVDEFLPWHRWFIWHFERELQRVSGRCDITLPYWDLERGDTLDLMFRADTFGTRNGGGCVPNGVAADWNPAEDNARCLQRAFDGNGRFTRDAEVLSRITNEREFERFAASLQGAPHATPHSFIGGAMDGNWSPDDPMFWLLHCNVDRMWAIWQDFWDHDEIANAADYRPPVHFMNNIDRPIRIRGTRRIDFDNPRTGQTPTPRELLSISDGIVSVQYVNDSLARLLMETSNSYRNGGNNPSWVSPANGPVRTACGINDPVQPSCRRDGERCGSRDDCCNNMCSSGVCGGTTSRCGLADSRCNFHDDCCGGNCRSGRCVDEEEEEAPPPPPPPPSPPSPSACRDNQESCQRARDCCSDFCSSRGVCARVCYGQGGRCSRGEQCCSNICNRNGRCVGRRALRSDDDDAVVVVEEKGLDFSSERLKIQFYDVIAQYPDDPAKVWDELAKEDCQYNAEHGGAIQQVSSHWMQTMFFGNNTHVFDCHMSMHNSNDAF